MPDTVSSPGNAIVNMMPVLIELIVYWGICYTHAK